MNPLIPLRPPRLLHPAPLPLLPAAAIARPDLALRRGDVVRVHRGVYAAASAWRQLAPWERYLARVHAVALARPDAVFCLDSAAALRGFGTVGEPRDVHVLESGAGTSRHAHGVRVHTTASPHVDVVEEDGLLTTGATETVVALARSRHPALALSVADAALRQHPELSVESLVAHNELAPSSRGRRHARWSLHRADALAETTLESLSRAAIEWLGFATPELQCLFVTADGTAERADFAWLGATIVGEADGLIKYDGRYGDPERSLLAEKQREDRIRRRVKGFARWGWSDVVDSARLNTILRDAGVPVVTPPQAAALHTMRAWLLSAFPRETASAPRDRG